MQLVESPKNGILTRETQILLSEAGCKVLRHRDGLLSTITSTGQVGPLLFSSSNALLFDLLHFCGDVAGLAQLRCS